MKKLNALFILLFLFTFCPHLWAQNFEWSEPAPFMLSDKDKTNAWLGPCGGYGPLICWEEKMDDSSTAIVYQRYLSNSPPVVLLFEPGIHYRHPQCRSTQWNADTSFLFFYEREENNETDIYYMKFTNSGSHSAPIPLATEGTHNHELALSPNDSYDIAAWNSDGNILATNAVVENGVIYYEPPDTLDMGNCSRPCMNTDWHLAWINANEYNDRVFTSHRGYPGIWSEPQMLAQEDSICHLISADNAMYSLLISWTFYEDDLWHITLSDVYSHYQLDFSSEQVFDFGIYSFDIITEGQEMWWGLYYFACVKSDGQHNEIFMYSEIQSSELFQLSFLETESRNPKFFTGERETSGYWVYLIWEANIDGQWQLYYSKAFMVWGAIDENELSKDIQISPNPATDFIQIQNPKDHNLSIQLFDVAGRLIEKYRKDDKTIILKTNKFSEGVYFLSLSDGERKMTQKLLLK